MQKDNRFGVPNVSGKDQCKKWEEKIKSEHRDMERRTIYSDKISHTETLNLMWVYKYLVPGDDGMVSVENFKSFLETVVKPADPTKYNKMMWFFDISRKRETDKKERAMLRSIDAFLNNFRTLENAFIYCEQFKQAAIKMATKLEAPSSMPVIERVKWLRIWVILIMNQAYYWGEFDENGELVSPNVMKVFEECTIYPESMIIFQNRYFCNLEDGDIQFELIKAFIEKYPQKVQEEVMKFAEIGYNTPYFLKLDNIRMNVKALLFKHSWLLTSFYAFTKSGIKLMDPMIFNELDKACERGGLESMPVTYISHIDTCNRFKKSKLKTYVYMEMEHNESVMQKGVTCQMEIDMYIEVYRWLQRHPTFRFGEDNMTLKEYEIENLFQAKPTQDKVTTIQNEEGQEKPMLRLKKSGMSKVIISLPRK